MGLKIILPGLLPIAQAASHLQWREAAGCKEGVRGESRHRAGRRWRQLVVPQDNVIAPGPRARCSVQRRLRREVPKSHVKSLQNGQLLALGFHALQ